MLQTAHIVKQKSGIHTVKLNQQVSPERPLWIQSSTFTPSPPQMYAQNRNYYSTKLSSLSKTRASLIWRVNLSDKADHQLHENQSCRMLPSIIFQCLSTSRFATTGRCIIKSPVPQSWKQSCRTAGVCVLQEILILHFTSSLNLGEWLLWIPC